MVLKVRHLQGRQFSMVADVHRYFRHMGNMFHSAWVSVCQVNFSWIFCSAHLDPMFLADFAVDKVFCWSQVNHCVDPDCLFFSVELYFDHDMVFVVSSVSV